MIVYVPRPAIEERVGKATGRFTHQKVGSPSEPMIRPSLRDGSVFTPFQAFPAWLLSLSRYATELRKSVSSLQLVSMP